MATSAVLITMLSIVNSDNFLLNLDWFWTLKTSLLLALYLLLIFRVCRAREIVPMFISGLVINILNIGQFFALCSQELFIHFYYSQSLEQKFKAFWY
jgi:hypothetical protein